MNHINIPNTSQRIRPLVLFFVFYTIAHFGIFLIINAVYWDDWTLYAASPPIILDRFRQLGSMFNFWGYLHTGLLYIGPWVYRLLTFFLMFASGILLYEILKRFNFLSSELRFLIVLLFLVMPFNTTRVTWITFPYTICHFMFFLAWYLMGRYRIMSLFLFFMSFNTNSFLVFYAVPFAGMLYNSNKLNSLKSIIDACIRNLDYLLLPFAYFFLKVYFFSPHGLYEGYNEDYSLTALVGAPVAQVYDLLRLKVSFGLTLVFAAIAYAYLQNDYSINNNKEIISSRNLFILGVLILILGGFPYWILGHIPSFQLWSSRHQLLLPLGISIGLSALIINKRVTCKRLLLSAIIGLSLAHNISTYGSLYIDWQKQKELINHFSKSSLIKDAKIIIIDDNTQELNALNRSTRFYEWNGMLALAFNDEKRFAFKREELHRFLSGEFDERFTSHYKAGGITNDDLVPSVLVEIDLEVPLTHYEKIINKIFPDLVIWPELIISVKDFDLKRYKHDNQHNENKKYNK